MGQLPLHREIAEQGTGEEGIWGHRLRTSPDSPPVWAIIINSKRQSESHSMTKSKNTWILKVLEPQEPSSGLLGERLWFWVGQLPDGEASDATDLTRCLFHCPGRWIDSSVLAWVGSLDVQSRTDINNWHLYCLCVQPMHNYVSCPTQNQSLTPNTPYSSLPFPACFSSQHWSLSDPWYILFVH